jgi:hypothetical protein
MAVRNRYRRTYVGAVAGFLLTNLALFLAYRLLFLWLYAKSPSVGDVLTVLLYGARLDIPLLGVELLLFLVVTTTLGRIARIDRSRALSAVTACQFLFLSADWTFFGERNQHVGEMLVAYALDPYQLYLGIAPVVKNAPSVLFFGTAIGVVVVTSIRSKPSSQTGVAPHPSWGSTLLSVLIAMLCALLVFEPVWVKKTREPDGWSFKVSQARYYMRFPSFILNQAVINPLHELLFVQLPAVWHGSAPYRLTKEEALVTTQSLLLDGQSAPTTSPLSRTIHSARNLGIRNVVVLQVEGLSASLLDHDVNGVPVTPFLRRLAHEGLSFANVFQSFDATSGAVFAAATSFHKSCFDEQTKRFTSYESRGLYPSLPRILGNASYHHYFFEGFRQSADDFLSFMANQGFDVAGYDGFRSRFRERGVLRQVDGDLGIYDGPFLQEVATILDSSTEPFTAQIMTTTSHSPWTVPEGFPKRFHNRLLDSFAYTDASIEAFMKTLRKNADIVRDTLFVLVADHTSVTFGDDLAERLRIPLIFFGEPIARGKIRLPSTNDVYASQVDILPTILDLLGGTYEYAGMGDSLLSPSKIRKGALSGSPREGIYVKGRYLTAYDPTRGDARLYPFDGEHVYLHDVSGRFPDVAHEMVTEYLAQYETARRLAIDKDVYAGHELDRTFR